LKLEHNVDFCVVGGGLAGLCAAIAAARGGAKTVLMHDRPLLGGNASSEIRMWVCGAHGKGNKETGILEEIQLENLYRNPTMNYSIWDSILYEKAMAEPNLTLLLNCSCCDADMDGSRIVSVKGWQGTAETWHTVYAKYFADCSGDSILAPLTGAEYRVGREGRDEYGESIAPEQPDSKTMGMSCLIQLRDTGRPQTFIPPDWAHTYPSDADLPHADHSLLSNFWWMELGGEEDSIHDTEKLRDELLKIAFGVWDHIKNYGGSCGDADHGAENYALEWMGFLPGKRESRRYVGDYIMTQHDIEAGGPFEDIAAYGGWSMDDHFPAGFHYRGGHPTIHHPAPSPYGIPYRCLYSKNIANLFFAGRNISATHTALSSTRVMGTCAILGQAVGTAAALAVHDGVLPRKVDIHQLQNALMADDCWLPGLRQPVPDFIASEHVLVNGHDRGDKNAWVCRPDDSIEIIFTRAVCLSEIRLVFDSDLNDNKRMPHIWPLGEHQRHLPECLVKSYTLSGLVNGVWVELVRAEENHQRLTVHAVNCEARAIRLTVHASHGADEFRVFSMYAKEKPSLKHIKTSRNDRIVPL